MWSTILKVSIVTVIVAILACAIAASCTPDPHSGGGGYPCNGPAQLNTPNPGCQGSPPATSNPTADGTQSTTGGIWNQPCVYWSGVCERKRALLIKGVDDKYGGNGLGPTVINEMTDVNQDDVANGPLYESGSSLGSGSNSLFDGRYSDLGIGAKSMQYNNERIFIDDKNRLGANVGTTCGSVDARDDEMLTYIANFGNAHIEGSPANAANDDILHATGTVNSALSAGDGDGGRQTGTPNNCNGETVQLWAMNLDSTDLQNLTLDYLSGKLGLSGSLTYVSTTVPGNNFWKATPAPGIANPNGDTTHPFPNYDSTKVGAAACYDYWYSDVSSPFYNSGNNGNPWTKSAELDTSLTTGGTKGIWDWTQSSPGIIKAQLDWVNALVKPLGTGGSRCNDGSKFQIWENGAGQNSGTAVANDTNHTWAVSQSCNADEYGGNYFGSGQGTATNVAGADMENAWIDFHAGYLNPKGWAPDINCATDIYAETSTIFAAVGGHSQLFDSSYDGYDMSTTTSGAITASSSPQTVTVGNAGIQGNAIGQVAAPLFVVDATNGNEIVSDAGQSGTTSIKAIFTKNHPSGTVIRTIAPESTRITAISLTYMTEVDARTVVQYSWWNTGQGSSFANHYDTDNYPEESFHTQWATTAAPYVGNAVYTKLTAQTNSGGTILTIQADSGASQFCTVNCWNGTRDMWVGQKLNLFDPGTTPDLETVTVSSIDSSTQIHVTSGLSFTHAAGAILRGTQAADGAQILGDGNAYADQSTSGGMGDYRIGGTEGTDGVLGGTSPNRAGAAYCRAGTSSTYMGQGPLFNIAFCVNMTNKAVQIKALYAAGGCTANCLTQSYAHYCGALVLNGGAVDDSCLGRTPPVNTTGTLSGNVFTPASMSGVKAFALYLLDTGSNLEPVCVVSTTSTTATLGATVSGGNCHAGGFAHTHSGTVALTSASATIQLDAAGDGGGGTICGYGGPYNTSAPQTSFSTANCPALTASSSTDTADYIAPMTGIILLQ